MKVEDIKKIIADVDCLSHRSSVILKIVTPFYMSIAKASDIKIVRKVIWVDDEYFVIAIKKKENLCMLEEFLLTAAPHISDILML